MATASFRFFGELNDFLPRERRDREFTAPCARAATTKHMIEALGVPHTEAGRLLVNGEAANFERLLAQGDAVLVYPQASRAQAGIRFVADAHLGGLARLLRMAGFDTLYDNGYQDEEIVAIAAGAGGAEVATLRTVLTRDRELLKRRDVEHGCYLHTIRPEAQLRELFARLQLAPLARPFTRCRTATCRCGRWPRPMCSSACRNRCALTTMHSPPATPAAGCSGQARTTGGCWRCWAARLG